MSGRGGAEDTGPASSATEIRTFLIADVRGYTLFTQERGDEAAAKLAAKFADLAREEVEARGGTLLELRGDEALCVFASAREAIRTAAELQRRFVAETLDDPELPLTVGIGLDAGEAVPVQGGYRGGALNLAARLCGQARAGEILASREVTHLARRVDGVRYEDRGSVTLKGITDPVAVVRVLPEGENPVVRLRPFSAAPPRHGAGPRRWAVIGGVVVGLALVAAGIPLLTSNGGGSADIGANSIARLNGVGDLEFSTPLGDRPGASAVGLGSLWVAQPDRGKVIRLDPEDGSITDTIGVGTAPSGMAVGEGSVWVTNTADGTVSRINAETGEPSQTLRVGSGPTGIAVGDGALWVADGVGAALVRVDPSSEETATVPLDGQPSGVAFTPGGVWVSVAPSSVARIDPDKMSVTLTKDVGGAPTAILAAFGSIWVTNNLDGTVTRLDPSSGRVRATVGVGEGPNALAAAGDRVWVANEYGSSVAAIDPDTDAVDRRLPVGGAAASLAAGGEGLWLAVGASTTEHRGGTLTVSTDDRAPRSLDPAVVYDEVGWSILNATNDGLLAYKKVGGPEGITLVPDLASALPDVSPDGLTYRFPLRAGIRYSTGEPVRPEDFRRAIERALVLSESGYLLSAIAGADACTPDEPAACDLSDAIVVDDEAVTFHLATPDAEFPFKVAMPFAFPVPADTPAADQLLQPMPATGPYMIEATGPQGLELVRNPRFEQWSGAAQPDGFVDRISWRFNDSVTSAYDRLSSGTLDLMTSQPAPEDLSSLRSSHPDRVVAWAGGRTFYVGFDVAQPPFDDERVRQALNDAIDRAHVVDLLGGPTIHRPTCQILPPSFQGYAPFCPYTLAPESNVWSAPDVHRARALIEDAAAAGTRVTVAVAGRGLPSGSIEVMRYITDVLKDLGLRADLVVEHDDGAYFGAIYGSPPGTRGHPQAFLTAWFSDYPGAGNFLEPQFACGENGYVNAFGWCDEALDARMDEAESLLSTAPGAANRAWMDIEHDLMEQAAVAPLTNPVFIHAVSGRVGNVQVNPQWGIVLSRLWVD